MTISGKYPDIAQKIRAHIAAGSFVARKLPNNQELAKLYGTTPITIRKALGMLQEQGVVEVTPGRTGTRIIREAGLAQDQTQATQNIALIHNSMFGRDLVFHGLCEELTEEEGYHLHWSRWPQMENGRTAAYDRLRDMLVGGFWQGLILAPVVSRQEAEALWRLGMPMVMFGRHCGGICPSVKHDDEMAAREIFRRIMERKRRQIAFLGFADSDPAVRTGKSISELLRQMAQEAGIGYTEYRGFRADLHTEPQSAQAVRELLATAPSIDCFVGSGYHIACGAVQAIRERSREPHEIPVYAITDEKGVDGAETLALPMTEIGRQAAVLLKRQMARKSPSAPAPVQVDVPVYWMR